MNSATYIMRHRFSVSAPALTAHATSPAPTGRGSSPAPTGRTIPAQGIALGQRPLIPSSPEGAKHSSQRV